MEDRVARLQAMIDQSGYTVFFGGAGVSTESGIPDFRSADGLYSLQYRHPPETMLSHSFFCSHRQQFFDFYRDRVLFENIQPNAAHIYLARLQQAGRLQAVITQNIDGLHGAAGSQNVLELHGSIHRNYCLGCGARYPMAFIKNSAGVPRCTACGKDVRPDVVLYEESLNEGTLRQAIRHIQNAELLLVGGTSLAVYPAAGLLDYFSGKSLVLINKTSTGKESQASLVIPAPIAQVFGMLRPPSTAEV